MNTIPKDDVYKVAGTPHTPAQITAARYLSACALVERAEAAFELARRQYTAADMKFFELLSQDERAEETTIAAAAAYGREQDLDRARRRLNRVKRFHRACRAVAGLRSSRPPSAMGRADGWWEDDHVHVGVPDAVANWTIDFDHGTGGGVVVSFYPNQRAAERDDPIVMTGRGRQGFKEAYRIARICCDRAVQSQALSPETAAEVRSRIFG